MSQKLAYDRRIAEVHEMTSDEESVRLEELSALVELSLGERLDPVTFDALASIQDILRRSQDDLVASLRAGRLSPELYLDNLNLVLKLAMDKSKGLLGEGRFDAIFGDPGRHPDGLVDREKFLGQFPTAMPYLLKR